MKGLIDSNILIYAYDLDSPFHKKATYFLNLQFKKKEIIFSIQNLNEAYAVFTRQGEKQLSGKNALAIIMFYLLNPNVSIIYPSRVSSNITFNLLEQRQITGNRTYDMVLVGQMKENRIHVIYTKNVSDFSGIAGIQAIDPLI